MMWCRARPVRKEPKEPRGAEGAEEDASLSSGDSQTRQRYIRWADLSERVFSEDVLRCPRCLGRRHRIPVVTDPETARRVLAGVRAAAQRSLGCMGGGDPSSPGPSRSPPPSGESEVRMPMPPRQGHLGFGQQSGAAERRDRAACWPAGSVRVGWTRRC